MVEMNHKHLAIDPPRVPKLIVPIETEMKRSFRAITKKIMIDVTKQLTQELKKAR